MRKRRYSEKWPRRSLCVLCHKLSAEYICPLCQDDQLVKRYDDLRGEDDEELWNLTCNGDPRTIDEARDLKLARLAAADLAEADRARLAEVARREAIKRKRRDVPDDVRVARNARQREAYRKKKEAKASA